jgi:hypothetical protein
VLFIIIIFKLYIKDSNMGARQAKLKSYCESGKVEKIRKLLQEDENLVNDARKPFSFEL